MSASSNTQLLAKSVKIEGKNSSSGVWLHYNQEIQGVEINHVNKDLSYLGQLQEDPMTPQIIFVGQTYQSLTFALDFFPGSNSTISSERNGVLPRTISKNNINVAYTPTQINDVFTLSLYSGDNSSERTIIKEITIDTIDVIPTYIEGNPTINTLNNLYTGLTMNFFENVDTGIVTTFSSESSVSNVTFSNGKCSFDYRTPTTHTSDKIIFTNLRNERIQIINKAPQNFELTNFKIQPAFSSWLLTPASQNFSYINTDSLSAIFTKDIQACTSITASSGLPSTIIPDSIIGNKINFEWSSLNTGNVTFTFNGLTAVDGSIDANVDGLTTVGPVILNTPATIIGWTGIQPNEPFTLYNVSVTFTKQLSTSRTPIITSSDTSIPVFTSISGSQVNFTVTTSFNPDYTVYTFNNVIALDGSIKNGATISAGAKIVSVQVETDIGGSYVTMSKLVKVRAQKVKIFLSKPIIGTLSLVTNSKCTFGVVTMITSSIAEFRVTPLDNSDLSLTIQSDNIICQEDSSQSTISHTFDLVYNQTVLNLFETSNKNSSKTTFDVGTDVALSLEVSKEILDLSSTTISSLNGIITNITFSSELGRYYYNFNLLPTFPGTNETIYVNQAKDLNGFKYDIFKSSLNFANVYPKTISYFGGGLSSGVSSFSLRKDVYKMVTITLSGVTSQTPTGYVYYSYTSDSLSPTLLGTYSFSPTGSISFPFTPTVLGTLYFYIKGITTIGFVQPDFLVSSGVDVLWFAPSSVSTVFSLNGATSGDDYNVMGLASGKTYSDVFLSLQWADNISNPVNIAETGAVQLYIGGSVIQNGIASYTYNSITNNISIGSINPGSRVGNLYISVTLTSPAGTTIDLETSGHVVYAVPDTVSIATISDGYSLINSKETQTNFFFSHTNSSINSLMTILDSGLMTANIVSVTNSDASIELNTSISIPRNIGAKVTSNNNEQTFTFMFISTRTTVQVIVPVSNIYTFPESSTFTVISDGISKGSIITLNKVSTLTWTFPNSLPSSTIHTITATGATISSSTVSPLLSSRLNLVYKLTPTIKQNIVPTVSVTFGGVTVNYTETVLLAENIYKLPSGLSAVVSFVGSSISGLDNYITTLAIGASYGSEAGNTLCGPGNTSSILLTLTGFDSVTENTNEITKVTCVNSSTLVAVGTDPTYTYTSSSHSAFIKLYTVPTNLTSSVKFSVIVTAPDGYTSTLNSSQTFLTELGATTVSLGSVATGVTLVSGSNVNIPVTFSNLGGILTPSTLISTNGTFSAISTSVTSGSFSATYTGEATSTDIIFTVSPTQRRIIVSVPASAILVWPTSASTAPVNGVTIGIASAMKTTLSSSVQSAVTASFGSLTASDASIGSSLSTPSVSGSFVTYTITPITEATYTSSVTLSVSTYSKTYNQTIVNADQIYVWPTGVDAVLSLNGATSGSDYNILGFAAGRLYSSSVTLTLKGIDPSPVNTLEVVATGAVRVYVSGTLVPNVVTSYTYNSITHEVVINSMTLGVQTGSLQFGLTVTAPSGSTYELLSTGHTVYALPDTVTIGNIGSGYSLVASNPTPTTFTFSHTNNTLNNSLGTFSTGASSSIFSLTSTETVTLSSTFGTSKVLNATVTASLSEQTFTFMFPSTRTTVTCIVLTSAIYSFPTSVTFSQTSFPIGSSTIVTATTNTSLVSGMQWIMTASSGTVGSGSGTTLSAVTQISFTYTANAKALVTGTLSLTLVGLSCVLSSTLATISNTYTSPTTLTYDGSSLNPTFYSRHFKNATLGSVKLIVDGELILGSPQAITNAVSSVTYTQVNTPLTASIYVTNSTGTTKTGGYNSDSFASSLILSIPGDASIDTSTSINPSSSTKTLTLFGSSTVLSTTRSKFYGKSIYVPGYSGSSGALGAFTNNGVKVTGMPSGFLSGDWTFEGWFYQQAWNSTLFQLGSGNNTYNTTTNPTVRFGSGSGQTFLEISGGAQYQASFVNSVYASTYALNQWVHLAVVRLANPSGFTVYINGVSVALTINRTVGTQPAVDPGTIMFIGCNDDTNTASVNMTGNIQDVRFYTTAKYSSNFSVDSAPTTVTTTASLTGATFTENSLTVQMTPTIYAPMTITTVLNMPSSTKTLTVSVPLSDFYTYIYPTSIASISPVTEIYTGDSTLMTFNLTPVDGAPNATAIIYQASTSSSTTPTQVSTANGTATGAGVLTASCTFPTTGTWYLYALISSPSGTVAKTRIVCSTPITVSTYVMPSTMTYDGSSINQATFGTGFGFKQSVASDVILTFARLYMGNPPLISNAYSSITYTQPSSAVFPSIYITSSTGAKIGGVNIDPFASWLVLAIPGNDLTDVSNSINSSSTTKGISTIGSAIVSITRSKFYGSSLYVPGWVASANTGFKITGMPTGFLYGEWTAEGWFYLTTLNTATLFKLGVCTNPSSVSNTTTNPTIRLLIESATTSFIEITAGTYYQATFSSSVFAINQWFHVALVRSSSPGNKGIFTVFVNGTAVTLTQNLAIATIPVGDPGTIMFIGCNDDTNTNSCNINGYIQDVRFYVTSKYKTNFSVTTAPISKTATLVSSTSTSLRLSITPDYYDIITFLVALKGPGSTTGTSTTTTSLTDIVSTVVQSASTVTARYLRLTLFYGGGTGTSGPSFGKLGIYTQSADAYEDTGISNLNIARSATFTSVSGSSATTTSMLTCINDTRTLWSASTTGTTFGAAKTAGPSYYTIDLGSIQTIGAIKISEVIYESTGWQWFSARLEISSDNSTWELAHLINAYGNETQTYLHSGYSLTSVTYPATVTSIYSTNETGVTKTGGYNTDAYTSSLILAFPGDSTSDVSNAINSSSTTKTLTFTTGYVTSSNPKFYGNSYSLRTPTGGGAFVVNGLPSNMFNSNFTLEVWIRPTIPSNPVNTNNTLLEIGGFGVANEMFIGFDTGLYSAGSTVGKFFIYQRGGTPDTYYTANIYSVNTWHHFALVRNGSNYVLYINGASAVTFPSWTLPTVTKFCMGGINLANYEYQDFYGQIQDLRLYTTAKYTAGFSVNPVISLVGESLVLAAVSRQYKSKSYLLPTSLGVATGTLSEGIFGKLSIVASTTQGATAIIAHSSAAPNANGGFTLWESQAIIVTSGLALLLDAGNTTSYSGTGTTWTDLSGNGYTGTLTNGPTYSSSNGGYIVFDGSNDTVTGTIPASVFSGAHTVSAWVYRRSVGPWSTVFASGGNSCTILRFMTNGTSTIVGANNAGLVATAPGVEIGADHLNQWLHVTMVYEGTASGSAVTVYVYKSGTLIKSNGQTLYWALSNTGSYNVGYHSSGGSSQWDGYISQVAVYNRALSAAEIDQNYNALKSRYGITGIVGGGTPIIGSGTFDSGVLTATMKPILSGQVYFYVKPTAPGGGFTSSSYLVVGPVTVTPYSLPTSISAASISALSVSTAASGQTLTLSGPNIANLVATNVVVYLNTSSTVVSNCTVTAYNSATGVVTFTATPTVSGMNTLYTKLTSPLGTTTTTLSFLGTTGQGMYVDSAPVLLITSSAGAISTRTFNGSTYICIRTGGTLTIPSAITGEILMIAGGGGGGFTGVGGGGAGGAAYISGASIPAGSYTVTVGAGGAGGTYDGASGTTGSNTVAFGVTVYGGGGGGHAGNALAGGCGGGAGYSTGSGGTVTSATGSLSGITGTLVTYGNAGGSNSVAATGSSYPGAGGGGIGGIGGLATASPMISGAGGVGKSTWSDWCAACGVGEGDTSGVFWIGGGGGAALNEISNARRAGAGGKGGGGRGGWAYTITSNGIEGIGTSGLDYSGGGGGSGHIVLSGTGGTNDYGNGPAGAGGSGVIIIKQATAGGYSIITAPTSVAGLQVWLDGSDPSNGVVPADGTAITTWVDKVTGNLHSAVPVNTANKAIFKGAGTVGGIKTTVGTMLFKNTPYRIPYTSFSPTYTIFSVFRAETGLTTAGLSMMPVLTNNSCYVLTGAADYQLYFGMYQDKYATAVGASGAWYGMSVNTPSTTVRGQWVIATMQYSASTKTTTTFLNGIAMTSKGPNAAAQNGGIAWNDLYIGQNNSAGADYRLHGYIGEILIYNSVLSTTDRQSVESYLSLKYGFGVDCSGTSGAYTMPTSFTVPSTSYLTATTITTTGASTSAAPIVVYYAATAGIISVDGLIQAGTGTLTSNSASILTTIPVGTWYVYIRVTSPSGVVGPFLGAPATTTVSLYTLPTSVAVGTCVLQTSVASGTCTLVLSGPNTANLVASKITVTVGSVAATVSSYTAGTATISFTVTPTTVGTTTITVVITAPPTGVTTNTTLTTTTVVQGPAASVAVTSGTLVYNTSQTLGLTFSDSASNVSYLAGTLNTDAVTYSKVTHASAPFWVTDWTGMNRATTSPLAWQDELGTSLVLALPLDAGTTIDQRSVAGGLTGQATVIATGTSSWLGPTPSVKFYGSSTSFSGSAYLSVSALPATLGSSDFTVELWANATTISGCLFATPSMKLELLGTTAYVWINNGVWVSRITASVSVSAVTWTHYAVVRYGKTTTLYINGVSRGTTTETIANSSTTITIGQYFTGYLTDVRVYVTAKYMSTFSIWTITLDTVTSGISLLLDAGKTTSYPGTGTTWNDLSGNGYNGTLTNGPTYSSNNSGYIAFDGSNDVVTGSISTSLFTGAHTITCWFYRLSVTDWSGLFSNNTTVYSSSILGFISSSNMVGINRAGVDGTAISVDLGSDHLNKWIYCAIVFAGASNGSAVTVYAYKNDSLITSTGNLYWTLSQSPTYDIGRHYGSSHYFNGYIPYVAVYNRALSATEIAQNYNALKGRYGFTSASSIVYSLVDIPVSSIVRTGAVLSVPITATSYRSARLFLSIKGAGTGGTNLELATIARPTQYLSPTSFTYSTTGTINVTVLTSVSITMTGADTVAGTVAVYASTSQTDLDPIIVCASAPLSTTGLATAPCTFSTAGTLYISIRAISPEGVLGSLVVSSVPLTVVAYSLPTNVSQTSLLETTTLSVGASTGSQTTMITGSNTSNVVSSNIAVFMNTSSTQVSNGTVTNYNSSTGLVTFTVTPTVVGMNTLYVKITAPVVGSTQSTTLAFTGTTGQGYFVDAAIPFPPFKLPAAGSATQSGTSSVILSDGSWSYVGGYLGVIVGRVFTGDFTLVVSWTTIDNSAAYFYVTAAMLSKTVASTSDFIWNNQETWSPSTYSSDFPGYSLLFSWYNSSYGGGSNRFIANWFKTFYRYRRVGNAVSLDFGASATGPWTSIVTGTTTTGSQVLCFIGTCSGETSQKTAKIESLVTATETFGSSNYTMPTSFTFSPITGYVDGSSSNMTITTLGGSTDSSPITVYYSSSATATGLTQAGTGTLASRTSTVSVAIPGGNWYVYIRITSPNAAVGPVILSSFTIASATATFYYPFASDIKNYTTGLGVSDAVMGVAGNSSGGTATFSEKSLVLTGSPTRNAAGASYVVLPSISSGNTSAFSCWFKSNNNGNFTRIIDMATNGSFRLYITGSNTLNFNDVYTISTTTSINNNTWNFIAINTTATTISWVINSGNTGNSGSGSISSKPVNFTGSVGYLGHSFGGDPEFAGSLKEVRFFANANLTSEQISTMYAGTTLLTSRQYTQATSIVSFTPAIPVQSSTTTFVVTLGGYETVVNGTSSVYYSATDSDTNPTLIGTAALVSGVVTVSGLVPLNTFYLYARSISPTSVQGSLLVSSLVTSRVYSFPTSVTFMTIQVNTNTQLTFAPADGLASATVIIYYHATNTSTNPTQCGTGTISSTGIANITCTFPSGPAVYVYARVTSPAGVQGSLLCSSITGIAAPVITITSSSGEIATRTFNGATYTCIRSTGTLTVYQPITGAEIFIIAGGGGGSFSAGAGGGAGGAAYISNASIPAGTYSVTVGGGGAAAANDGGVGSAGGNSVGFGVTVYGGGGGSHNSTGYSGGCGGGGGYGQNTTGGGVTAATGSLTGITGNLFTYGNAGGGNPTPNSYVGGVGAGGGIGGVGGSATATPTGGTGGVGRSTWSDWCAACGVGEGDTSGIFWIGGGGGGTSNETSGLRRAGDGGKGGGGKGGFATVMTTLGFDGCATGGLDYSGGGGGGGHITLPASLAGGYIPPGGRGGSGVIIIKQTTSGVYTTINAPTDVAGLQVWLDGSDPNNGTVPVNGSTIGTWVDKVTGNLHSATPVNTANKAVYKAAGTIGGIKNTLGTMYFNNTAYKIPYTSFSPTYTIFSVFRVERGLLTSGLSMTPVTTNSSCYILSGGQESCLYFGMLYDQFSTAVGVPPSTWYGMAVNTPATYIRSQWVIATMQYSAATKTTTTFLNGITMTAKGPDATTQNSGSAWNDFYIGQSVTNADYRLQGYIGEILIYNSLLSTVDRKSVESYLSLKYGLGIAITRMYTFPTSISFTSLQTSAFSTTLSFSPADGFDSASVIIYYHATNSSTSPTQCGTGTISSTGSANITCTLPEGQVVYIYAKVTSPTGVEGVLLCSTLSGTVTSLPQAYVAFTTANGGVSVSTSSGNISAWNQTGSTIASTVTMKPAAVHSGIVAAGSNVTLVNNIFGTQPGISSNAYGCMTTSASILFGGAADTSLQFSIYILGRPNSNSAQAQYLGGGFSDTAGNSLNGHLSIFSRGPSGNIANNTQNTTEMWKPGGNGQQGPFPYPNANGFEIWCLCKNAGYIGTEVYRNNATLASTGADYISQRNIAGPSPYELSAFWRIGGGASYYANGSSYIGAFYVYNTYHDSTMRGKIQSMLETSFGMTAS